LNFRLKLSKKTIELGITLVDSPQFKPYRTLLLEQIRFPQLLDKHLKILDQSLLMEHNLL
jgi:hypothetical protein